MDTSADRRHVLTTLGGLGALAGLSGVTGLATLAGARENEQVSAASATPSLEAIGQVPWPYRSVDPEAVAQAAYAAYQKGLCMLGVFEPMVRSVADRLGPPYTAFPFAMFRYGAGGVAGWGTLCGSLNGAAAAFSLLSAQPGPLTAALFTWYEQQAVPDYTPAGVRFVTLPVVAGSLLCHASVTRWCSASGKKYTSPERFERCGALAASVARRAVMLLNAQAAGTLSVPPPAETTSECLGCHGGRATVDNASGRMACSACHTPAELAAKEHPKA